MIVLKIKFTSIIWNMLLTKIGRAITATGKYDEFISNFFQKGGYEVKSYFEAPARVQPYE